MPKRSSAFPSRRSQSVGRFICASIMVLATILLLSAIAAASLPADAAGLASTGTSQANQTEKVYDDTNAVTGGMSRMVDDATQATDSVAYALGSTARSVTSVTAKSGDFVGQALLSSLSFVGDMGLGAMHLVGAALSGTVHLAGFLVSGTAHIVWNSAAFVLGIPGHFIGHVSKTAAVSSVIKPGENAQVPMIDPGATALAASHAAAPATPAPAAQTPAPAPQSGTVAWPLHGAITTQFGVPEPPFQPIHTGLDISDGKARGTTPIHPFKAGTVIDVIQSSSGLGNHVVVDHGNGLTSVYGHLNSTAVRIGQTVDLTTILGYEGTTGASTGVHLHFEIRVNGTAVDPHGYIPGQP